MKQIIRKISKQKKKKLVEYELFVYFSALPKIERQKLFGFHTEKAFREKYKVNSATIQNWKKEKLFWELRENYLKEYFKFETPEVLNALKNRIMKYGKSSDVKIWLEYIENWGNELKKQIDNRKLEEIHNTLVKILES